MIETEYINFEKIRGSLLELLVSGKHEDIYLDDYIFIDRDPSIFKYLISMLRNDLWIPKNLN